MMEPKSCPRNQNGKSLKLQIRRPRGEHKVNRVSSSFQKIATYLNQPRYYVKAGLELGSITSSTENHIRSTAYEGSLINHWWGGLKSFKWRQPRPLFSQWFKTLIWQGSEKRDIRALKVKQLFTEIEIPGCPKHFLKI